MKYFYLLFLILLLGNCTPKEQSQGTVVDFGAFTKISDNQLLEQYRFVKLETNESCLLGAIDQIEVFANKIYILDSYQTKSIYVFDKEGKYLNRLEGNRRGPGEFLMPLCFAIDPTDSALIVKDHQQSALLRYALNDLSFIDKIKTEEYPISFGVIPEQEALAFYYPDRGNNDYQLRITDKNGQFIKELLPVDPKSKVLHGLGQNFYVYDGKLNVFPHFSNTIFSITPDSTTQRYHFYFGDYHFPDDEIFQKKEYNSQAIMSEIMNNSYVRLMAPYETDEHLLVKYYVKRQVLLGIYNKKKHTAINLDPEMVIDSLHLGTFPVPIGFNHNEFIGQLTLDIQQKNRIMIPELQKLMADYSEDSNPILILVIIYILTATLNI